MNNRGAEVRDGDTECCRIARRRQARVGDGGDGEEGDAGGGGEVRDGEAFGSTIAKLYRVKGIPANYLITSDGKRVARHLRGDSLEQKLGELLPLQ